MRTMLVRAKRGIGGTAILFGIGAALYVCMVSLTVSMELIRFATSSAISMDVAGLMVELGIAVLAAVVAAKTFVYDARVTPFFAMLALTFGAMTPAILVETLFFGVPIGFLNGAVPALVVLASFSLVMWLVKKLAKRGYTVWAWLSGAAATYLILDVATLLSKHTNVETWQAPIAVLLKAMPGAGVYQPGLKDLVWAVPAAAFMLAYAVKAGRLAQPDHSGIEVDGPARSDSEQ